jgi:hypothetical protein
LQSQIDVIYTLTFVTNITSLISRIEILETCCEELKTSTGILQSEIDTIVSGCCDPLATSTEFLQSQIDVLTGCCEELKTSTGFLQSQIDVIHTVTFFEDLTSIISRIEILETCCEELKTSTGQLQSEIDVCCSRTIATCCEDLISRIETLESEIEKCCNSFDDKCCQDLISKVEQFETCCEDLTGRVATLECSSVALKTLTCKLKSQIDTCCSKFESCCESLTERIEIVESDLERCCDNSFNDHSCKGLMPRTQDVSIVDLRENLASRAELLEPENKFYDNADDTCFEDLLYRIKECLLAFESCNDDLASRVETLESCCSELQTNDDILISCCKNVASSFEECIHSMTENFDTRLELLEENQNSLASRLDALEICCEDAQTIVDSIEDKLGKFSRLTGVSFGDDIASRVESLESSCQETKTRIKAIENCCEEVKNNVLQTAKNNVMQTSNNYSAEEAMNNLTKLANSYLNSRLEMLCATYNELTSKVNARDESCDKRQEELEDQFKNYCHIVSSRVDALEDACEDVEAEVEKLLGKLKDSDNVIFLSYGDELTSRVEFLESCCEDLQSQIDLRMSADIIESCTLELVTKKLHNGDVQSGDWSFDNRFVAIGLGDSTDDKILKIYELVNSTLQLRAEWQFAQECNEADLEIPVVRWHPSKYRLAVGLRHLDDDSCEFGLHIFDFNSETFNLIETDVAEQARDVCAASWRPCSLPQGDIKMNDQVDDSGECLGSCPCESSSDIACDEHGDDVLVIGRDYNVKTNDFNRLVFYRVSVDGQLSEAIPAIDPDCPTCVPNGDVVPEALDWNSRDFVAVGVASSSPDNTLQIYAFDPNAMTLTKNIVTSVTSDSNDENVIKHVVASIDWHPTCKNLLAVGLFGTQGQLVQVFSHFPNAPMNLRLLKTGGISDIGASVQAVDWNPNGQRLAIGTDGKEKGTEFNTYLFDRDACQFSTDFEFDLFNDISVETVRWAPNGRYALNSSDNNGLSIYQACKERKITARELLARLEALESDIAKPGHAGNNKLTNNLSSRIEALKAGYESLKTTKVELRSYIDTCYSAIESGNKNITSRIEILEKGYDQLKTSTDVSLYLHMIKTSSYVIPVAGSLFFDLSMLPQQDSAVVFEFQPYFGRMEGPNAQTPKLIIDPAIFGNGGRIPIGPNRRIIFSGEGIVRVLNGVVFDYMGTVGSDKSDWPAVILQNGAVMDFKNSCEDAISTSTVTFGGQAGKFIIRDGASMLLDAQVNVIFGENLLGTEIQHIIENNGRVEVHNPQALLSYNSGIFDIVYKNHSSLNIWSGLVEMNTLHGAQKPGIIRTWNFVSGASLSINKTGNGAVDGLLRLSPNYLNSPINFDNRASTILHTDTQFAGGNIQFRSFDNSGKILVDTTLIVQGNYCAVTRTMVELFMELTYINSKNMPMQSDSTILTRIGTMLPGRFNAGKLDSSQDGRLAAFCPVSITGNSGRDGSIVGLKQGDHTISYVSAKPGGPLDQIKGSNLYNKRFTISKGNESTRVN